MVVASLGTEKMLVAAGAANQIRLAGYGGARCKALVAQVVGCVDGLFVKFGQENVGDGVEDWIRRALQQVGEIDKKLAFAETDGGVQRGEAAETDRDGRHRRPGTQRAVLFLKDGNNFSGHLVQITTCRRPLADGCER